MASTVGSSRVVRLVVIILLIVAVGAGLYGLHKYRKKAAATKALASGLVASDAREYTKAANELGRYVAANSQDIPVLMKYADAQIKRRPQSRASVSQAVAALDKVLRLQPGHAEAAEQLITLFLGADRPAEAEHAAEAWCAAAPDNATAQRYLAQAYWAGGKRAKAVEILAKLSKAHPEDPDTASLYVSAILAGEAESLGSAPATATAPGGDGSATAPAVAAALDRLFANWDRCLVMLDEVVARNPNSATARITRAAHSLGIAKFAVTAKDLHRAEECRRRVAEDLVEAAKLESVTWKEAVQLARLFSETGMLADANAQLDRAETLAPTEVDIYLVRCGLAIDLSDAEGGAAVLDRALKLSLGEGRYDLLAPAVELYAMANRPRDARARLEEARKPDTPVEVLRYLEGVAAFADGNVADAIPKLEEALKLAPEDPRLVGAYLWLGRAYVASGNPRRAILPYRAYIQRATKAKRLAATGHLELSHVYAELGRWEDAAKASFEAGGSHYAARPAMLRTLQMRSLLSRPGGAKPDPRQIEVLYEATRQWSAGAPKDVELRIQLARLTYYRGQLDEAVKMLKSTRDEQGEKYATTRALIGIYVEASMYKEAIEECTAAIASADRARVPSWQATLAEVYALQGDQEMARKTFTAAAEQATGSDRTLIRSSMAEWLIRQQHPEEARDLLLRILEEEPNNVAVLLKLLGLKPDTEKFMALVDQLKKVEGASGLNWRYWLAVGWLDSPDWGARRKDIESNLSECLAKDPEFSEAALALGRLYQKVEDWNQVLSVCGKAFALDSRNTQLAQLVLIAATRLQRWGEIDQVLATLPKEPSGDPSFQRLVQQLRVEQSLRRGDREVAIALLEEQVKDATDYTARLGLAAQLARSPDGRDRALQLLAEAAAIAPDAPEVLVARVQFHVNQLEFKEALDVCGQAIAQKPTARAYQLRAGLHEAQKDLDAAAADLKQMASLEGEAESGHLALGRLYYRWAQYQQAVESWEAGLKLVPDSVSLRGALAESRLNSQDKTEQEKGRVILEGLLKERPEDERFLLMRAGLQLASGEAAQLKACEDTCNEIVKKNPKSAEAFSLLARTALVQSARALTERDVTRARRERARALDYIDLGLTANPQDVRLLVMQSELLLEDSPNRAEIVARRALALQPSSERAATAYAESLRRSGQQGQAIRALARFLEQADAKKAFTARLMLAEMYASEKDFAKAEALLEEAEALVGGDKARQVDLDRGRLGLLVGRGDWDSFVAMARECVAKDTEDVSLASTVGATLLQSGDPERAKTGIEFLVMVTQRRPNDPATFSRLGLGYYQAGRIEEAAAAFEQGLKLDPDHLQLANDLAWILCEEQKKPEEAAKRIAKAIATIEKGSSDPVAGSLWDTWGVIQYRLGKLEESKQALERCLALGPELAVGTRQSALYHLARTMSTTDKTRAAQLLQELLATPKERLSLLPAELAEAQALMDQVRP